MVAHAAELRLPECVDSGLLRVRYFPRQLLSADDMQTDQDHFREKQRRHNRFLHGWGSVCGLGVVPMPTREAPWRVRIEAGYALGPHGDEIYLAEPVFLDLALCGPGAATDPCAPDLLRSPSSATDQQVFVAIQYAECLARPVRAMPAGCACDEEACEYSRIRDSFQIECLTELPPSHQPPPGPTLCDMIQGRQLPVCQPCPAEPWVVLAQVTLPASSTNNIIADMIDNFTFRRQVFSTAALQEQLIRCCCEAESGADLVASVSIEDSGSATGTIVILASSITVTNNGPSSAEDVVLTSTLSANGPILNALNFETTHDGEWTDTEMQGGAVNAQFTASIGTLAAGETATLSFNTEAENRPDTRVTHSIEVDASTHDPDPTNNSAADTFSSRGPGPGPGDILNPG